MPYRHQRHRLTLAAAPRAGLALRRRLRLAWRWVLRRIDWLWRDYEIERYQAAEQRKAERREYARRRSSLPN